MDMLAGRLQDAPCYITMGNRPLRHRTVGGVGGRRGDIPAPPTRLAATSTPPRFTVPTSRHSVRITQPEHKRWRRNTVKGNDKMRPLLLRRGRSAIVRAVMLCASMVILSGCATKPPLSDVSCPDRPPIPAQLSEPSSPSAQRFVNEVQSYLVEVQESLARWRQTKTPSSE